MIRSLSLLTILSLSLAACTAQAASPEAPVDAVEESSRAYDECMLEEGMPSEWVYWDGTSPVGEDVSPQDPAYFTMETYEAASAVCDEVLLAGSQGAALSPEEVEEQQALVQPLLECLSENGVPTDIVAAFRDALSTTSPEESESLMEGALGSDAEERLEEHAPKVDLCLEEVNSNSN